MLTKNQIISIFQEKSIRTYETLFNFDCDCDVTLKSDCIDDFISLVEDNEIRSVFYCFCYADMEDYLINDDDMDYFDDDIVGSDACVNRKRLVYNEYSQRFLYEKNRFNNSIIYQYDFSKPTLLCIYCILNGLQVGILQANPWNNAIPDKKELLSSIEDELNEGYLSADKAEQAKTEKQRKEILNSIINYLDTTDEWHSCTNQRLRHQYCYNLIAQYQEKTDVHLFPSDIFDALEIRWNQYKLNKSKGTSSSRA